MKKISVQFIVASFLAILSSCSKTDNLQIYTVQDFYPLSVGKVFIYRLDSTVLGNFNQTLVTRSFIAKDSVESSFTDAAGAKSFRIFRYLRDTLQTRPWQFASTYIAAYYNNTIRYNDNNLWFVALANPVSNGTSWNGTQLINTISPSNYAYFSDWRYEYQNVLQPFTTKKGIIDSTVTVFHKDETLPDIPFNTNNYQERSFSKEVYAKGVGLIYKDFLRWVYQPPSASGGFYQQGSFGIRLNLISYQ